MSQELLQLDPASIKVGKYHTRKSAKKAGEVPFDDLVASIKRDGVLSPVLVRPVNGHSELVMGTRRVAAAKAAKKASIPAISREMDDETARRVCLAENLFREDLTPLEEAGAIRELCKVGLSYEQIGAELGRSPKWVALRDNLRNLSKTWKTAIADPKKAVSTWSASLLHEVARLPQEIQDGMYYLRWPAPAPDDIYPPETPTVAEIRQDAAENWHVLDLALWELSDDKVAKGCRACTGCPSRTDVVPELFDTSDFEFKGSGAPAAGARCLDPKCWTRKQEASVRRELDAAAVEKRDLVLIHDGYGAPKFAGKQTHGDGTWSKSSKKAGGKEAIVVDGPKAGSRLFVKMGRAAASNRTTSSTTKSSHAKATPLKDRRRNLNRLRRKLVLGDMVQRLDAIEKGEAEPPKLTTTKRLAVCLIFGLDSEPPEARESAFAVLKMRARLDDDDLVDRLFRQALYKLRSWLNAARQFDKATEDDCRTAADFLEMDYDELWKSAVDAKPEPKSWAHLAADGAPKKAAKSKAKAKAPKTKAKAKAAAKKPKKSAKSKAKPKAAAKPKVKPAAAPAPTKNGPHTITLRCNDRKAEECHNRAEINAPTVLDCLEDAISAGWTFDRKAGTYEISGERCPACNVNE